MLNTTSRTYFAEGLASHNCVAVAWANNRRIVSTVLGTAEYPTQDMVFSVYKTQNPGFPAQDDGMDEQSLWEWLAKNTAPDGSKLAAFAAVDYTNPAEVKAAIAIFGSVIVGINVLDANMTEFDDSQPWDYVPDSPVDGGHGVVVAGYGPAGSGALGGDERFVTWGQETSFTDAFWANETEECWVLIYPEHLGTKAFIEGMDYAQLAADYQEITGRPFPPQPAPAPPPPPPGPSPVIDAADRALWAATGRWVGEHHVGDNASAARALKTWAKAKGF